MRWLQEQNQEQGPWAMNYVLATEADEPLDGALVEYWRKILTYVWERGSQMECAYLAFQVHAREYDDQPPYGDITCEFKDALHKAASKDSFIIRSHELTFLRPDNSLAEEWDRKVLRWTLDQCLRLRAAGHADSIKQLFHQVQTVRPHGAVAAGLYGWFDLGMYLPTPGPLSAEDLQLLNSVAAAPKAPAAPKNDPELAALMQKVSAKLADMVPQRYASIAAAIRIKQDGDQFGIGYQIEVPADSPASILQPSVPLHDAARELIAYWTRNSGSFPGIMFRVYIQPDSTLKTQATVIK